MNVNERKTGRKVDGVKEDTQMVGVTEAEMEADDPLCDPLKGAAGGGGTSY